MKEINYIPNFLSNADKLFDYLATNVDWDERMMSRKTASYGVAYNYSQMSYPHQHMPDQLVQICEMAEPLIGFKPNNCLINYYPNGQSAMGYHSDQTDILTAGTGIAIVSLGGARLLRFRNIINKNNTIEYEIISGSLFYMDQTIQQHWEHAIPKSKTAEGRISLTLRNIVTSA